MCQCAHMRINATVTSKPQRTLAQARDIGKALSDMNRLRILGALNGRELCVCHLVEMLEVDASNVSRHVSLLRRAGLIAVRKEGRWLHCTRAEQGAALWPCVDELLDGVPELERDRKVIDGLCGC